MTDRVVMHYQTPVSKKLENHMLYDTGLTETDRQLVLNLRKHTGDTQFYADLANMNVKRFSERMGKIHVRMVNELIRLSEIGINSEKSTCSE